MRRVHHRLAIMAALILSQDYPGRSEQPAAGKPVPEGHKSLHTDRYGDALPLGALVRLGTVRLRHGYAATSVAFSPDGKSVASGEQGNGVHIWDASTRRELLRLGDKQAPISGIAGVDLIAFSPDGKRVVAGGGTASTIVVWDIATGKEVFQFQGHQGRVYSIAYSPDGQTVASGGGDSTIRLWDTTTGRELRRLVGHEACVRAVAFSPDGTVLASCAETVRLWSVATGKELRRCEGHKFEINTVAFSPDGKLLASGGHDQTIRFWDVDNGRELRQWGGRQLFVLCVAFSPDGNELASAGLDGTIRLWQAATGAEIRAFQGHQGPVCCMAFSPDGKVLASAGGDKTNGVGDKTVRLWDVATGKELGRRAGHEHSVSSSAFSADGRTVVTGSQDGTVRLWDAATGEELCRYYNTALPEAASSNEGSITAAARPVQAVAFSPDGRTLAWAGPQICLRETATGKELRRLGNARDQASCLAFSPDGQALAAGNHIGWVRVYDISTGQELRLLAGGYGSIVSLSFSPDGKAIVLAHGMDGGITVWEVATGNRLLFIRVGQEARVLVNAVAFFADGKRLVSGLAAVERTTPVDNLSLWDARTGQRLGSLKGQLGEIAAVAISGDGRTLASATGGRAFFGGSDRTIRLWEVATGQERCCFQGHLSGITSIAFAPDARSLVSAGADTTAIVWDVTGLRASRQRQGLEMPVRDLECAWRDLAEAHAARAHSLIWALVAAPQQTLAFLKDRLGPAAPLDRQRAEELIAELASNRFPVRQHATQELEKLADLAEAILRRKLQEKIPLETRERVERLLEKLEPSASPERLRDVRAIAVLEHIGTSEAKQLLQTLATGTPEARRTKEAKTSLERLAKRPAPDLP